MKSDLGNTSSHFFFTTQGFITFRNREISTSAGAIREQLEDQKVGRGKDFLVRRVESAKHFIRTTIEPGWIVLCLLPVLPLKIRPIIQIDGSKLMS
uniref:DNA-directed RNA polymerase n=1 Tax=Solanum lycopersicum TaxID=4081 RepID=K4CCX9_SOLLC